MFRTNLVASWLSASVLLIAGPALAYVGPGAGITMLGALWGVLVALVLALGAVLYLPIRTVLRKRRQRRPEAAGHVQPARPGDGEPRKRTS